jgi:hypothetical protein
MASRTDTPQRRIQQVADEAAEKVSKIAEETGLQEDVTVQVIESPPNRASATTAVMTDPMRTTLDVIKAAQRLWLATALLPFRVWQDALRRI